MRWLHVSNIHFGYEQRIEIESMRDGLLELAARIPPVDCLFITGDVCDAPNAGEEFPDEAVSYIRKLQDVLQVAPHDTFLVQGNHDANRPKSVILSAYEQGVSKYRPEDGEIDADLLKMVQERRKGFRELYAQICGEDEPPGWHYCRESHGFRIICLNTAMLSFKDGEQGSLILGTGFLKNMFDNIDDSLPLIVVAHHDLSHIVIGDQTVFKNRLDAIRKDKKEIIPYLCGHTHIITKPHEEKLNHHSLLTFTCGAGMNQTTFRGRVDMSVLSGEMDKDRNNGYVQSYRWEYNVNAFLPNQSFSYTEKQGYALDGRWYFPDRPKDGQVSDKNRKVSWLQLSDLHVFQEADLDLMLDDYGKLANIIRPDFLIVTGDFRHLGRNPKFDDAANFLTAIMEKFRVKRQNVLILPGNHDVNECPSEERTTAVEQIIGELKGRRSNYAAYSEYKHALYENFTEFDRFVRNWYAAEPYDPYGEIILRVSGDESAPCSAVRTVSVIRQDVETKQDEQDRRKVIKVLKGQQELFRIVCVNTALISDGERKADNSRAHYEIVDINALTKHMLKIRKDQEEQENLGKVRSPVILAGHHGLDALYPEYSSRIRAIIERYGVSAYLHGDIHQYAAEPILPLNMSGTVVPSIACGKSAPQSGDAWSYIGAVFYEWNGLRTKLQAFRWDISGFHPDTRYMRNINENYTFPMH